MRLSLYLDYTLLGVIRPALSRVRNRSDLDQTRG